jgi:hypothetical protein
MFLVVSRNVTAWKWYVFEISMHESTYGCLATKVRSPTRETVLQDGKKQMGKHLML